MPVPHEDDQQDTAPVTVQRQSVRAAFQQQDPPGANRPGTPPPATPTRVSSLGAAAVAETSSSDDTPPTATLPPTPPAPPAARTSAPPSEPMPPPVLPSVVRRPVSQTATTAYPSSVPPVARATPPPPAGTPDDPTVFDFGDVIGAQTAPPTADGKRFDPTALVLIVVGLVVVIGVIFAFRALFSGFDTGGSPATPDTAQSAEPTAPAEPSQDAAAPEEPAVPVGGAPVIASATSIDTSDADGEHEEDVAKAFDSDPTTFWYTHTYKRDDFAGIKDAVGYVVTLTQKTTVSTVTLHANSTGGNVEIRATDATNPTGGEVLASGPFGPDAVFTLDPAVETQSLVLWITQLPTAADGAFRLELTEIALS